MRVRGASLNICWFFLVKGFQGKFLSTMCECYCFLLFYKEFVLSYIVYVSPYTVNIGLKEPICKHPRGA
jgi:hypothetical protein